MEPCKKCNRRHEDTGVCKDGKECPVVEISSNKYLPRHEETTSARIHEDGRAMRSRGMGGHH